ncbi:hypothetical protein NHH03_10945 [Stieleria sp. TO1_6]|nr:hypothetical protein [Stieleria tagensis]MCO8122257.1 hypothetical protein [Stieleria tagensis]
MKLQNLSAGSGFLSLSAAIIQRLAVVAGCIEHRDADLQRPDANGIST